MAHLFDSLKISDFDHIEFAVNDLDKASEIYHRMGFRLAGSRELLERGLTSKLFIQNGINIVLSHSGLPEDPVCRFLKTHGEGVVSVGLLCEDAISAFEQTIQRGGVISQSPRSFRRDFGTVTQASLIAFGDVQHTFVSRQGGLFLEGFDAPLKIQSTGNGLLRVDHLTCNVEHGNREKSIDFYTKVFGLEETKFFHIHTNVSGVLTNVLQSPNGVLKLTFNEPARASTTEPGSQKPQIEEFITINHGAGVQHIAFTASSILESVRLLKKEGIRFLETPDTYYEALTTRFPSIQENLGELKELGIQVDGEGDQYLLQSFTENIIGPFFYEMIQRRGHEGFGEGNIKALWEALERQEARKGVLK